MERVLIVAKTQMGNGFCVSGLTRSANKSLRLIPPGRFNQPQDTEFEVGQTWDIEFQEHQKTEPPHVEDVTVTQQKFVGQVNNMREILEKRV